MNQPVLTVSGLTKHFSIKVARGLRVTRRTVQAVSGVDLTIDSGTTTIRSDLQWGGGVGVRGEVGKSELVEKLFFVREVVQGIVHQRGHQIVHFDDLSVAAQGFLECVDVDEEAAVFVVDFGNADAEVLVWGLRVDRFEHGSAYWFSGRLTN